MKLQSPLLGSLLQSQVSFFAWSAPCTWPHPGVTQARRDWDPLSSVFLSRTTSPPPLPDSCRWSGHQSFGFLCQRHCHFPATQHHPHAVAYNCPEAKNMKAEHCKQFTPLRMGSSPESSYSWSLWGFQAAAFLKFTLVFWRCQFDRILLSIYWSQEILIPRVWLPYISVWLETKKFV